MIIVLLFRMIILVCSVIHCGFVIRWTTSIMFYVQYHIVATDTLDRLRAIIRVQKIQFSLSASWNLLSLTAIPVYLSGFGFCLFNFRLCYFFISILHLVCYSPNCFLYSLYPSTKTCLFSRPVSAFLSGCCLSYFSNL